LIAAARGAIVCAMRRFVDWLRAAVGRWLRALALLVPFGLLARTKPRHYREMLAVAWENRGRWRYAWRILRHGVCDGCSLGPRGLRDDVIPGTHLCITRLRLLRLNTMDAIPDALLGDAAFLRTLDNEALHRLGRVPYPLRLRRGARGFERIGWDEAARAIADAMRATRGERMGFFVTSRGLTNETYYTIQKLARVAGTANLDSCARLCHAASTAGLKQSLGWGAPTCSLSDLVGTELLVLFGTDLANNQPMTMKYLHEAKKRGTRVVVVNPFREPALDRYWVPSVASSALFGTAITDEFYAVRPGGDIAFLSGALKALDEMHAWDEGWVAAHTDGADALRAHLAALAWRDLEEESGLAESEMRAFASTYARARTAVLLYSMGLTQHRFGVENVKMVVNLALARGNVGREKTGVVPIRGHSGVQGTAECGVDPRLLPGAQEPTDENVARFEAAWRHPIPREPGLRAAHLLDRAAEGGVDLLYLVGGNYLDTMPDPANARRGLERTRLRVHQDIVLNTSTLVEAEEVIVLPAQTRYEQRSGGTSTSTERRIRFTPEIDGSGGPQIKEARPEWEIPLLVGRALTPERADLWDYRDTSAIRDEMGRLMPMYAGIEGLAKEGDAVQWGGARLGEGGSFPLPGGRARMFVVEPPRVVVPDGKFFLTSRRGKQFNSITWGARDPLLGIGSRRDVLFAAEDLARLGLREGDPVRLSSEQGEMRARARVGPCRRGHLQAYWPECNVLVGRAYDPVSGEPDYNAIVAVERAA
jgi:molybdopterin-dependent oxidoreductase alpha subunit